MTLPRHCDCRGSGPRLNLNHQNRPHFSHTKCHFRGLFSQHPGPYDFVLAFEGQIVPIEVKAGGRGSLRSLHQFVGEKHVPLAVRFDSNPPSVQTVSATYRPKLPDMQRQCATAGHLECGLLAIMAYGLTTSSPGQLRTASQLSNPLRCAIAAAPVRLLASNLYRMDLT